MAITDSNVSSLEDAATSHTRNFAEIIDEARHALLLLGWHANFTRHRDITPFALLPSLLVNSATWYDDQPSIVYAAPSTFGVC